MIKKFISWTIPLFTITALLAAGCGAPTSVPQTPTQEARQPFSARAESYDGAIVAWGGYTDGYEPGAEEEFDITIKNETEQTWHGRYCLQLLDRQLPKVIATLEQRAFTLEPGVGFSDSITVRFPDVLDEGTYGLSLAVRRPADPMVDLVPIQIGETDEVRRATTQRDMDASLEACPPVEEAEVGAQPLVGLAVADLAERLGISPDEIEVQSVEKTEFPDTSLGVPEPGKTHAQVITPGYIVELTVEGQVYVYHGSGERVVAVPDDEGQPPTGRITIKGVQVSSEQVIVHGQSTLPNGTCLGTELWADGELQTWWPTDACARVQDGAWQLAVPLGAEGAPNELDPTAQYMLRAWLPGGPNIVSVFAFDLAGPPTPEPSGAEHLVGLAKADLAERLGINPDEIEVQDVEKTEFPDASLGVPEPGKMYAQVITPGYIIKLAVDDAVYEYHTSDDRVVLVPEE
jgi:hypothetical protein